MFEIYDWDPRIQRDLATDRKGEMAHDLLNSEQLRDEIVDAFFLEDPEKRDLVAMSSSTGENMFDDADIDDWRHAHGKLLKIAWLRQKGRKMGDTKNIIVNMIPEVAERMVHVVEHWKELRPNKLRTGVDMYERLSVALGVGLELMLEIEYKHDDYLINKFRLKRTIVDGQIHIASRKKKRSAMASSKETVKENLKTTKQATLVSQPGSGNPSTGVDEPREEGAPVELSKDASPSRGLVGNGQNMDSNARAQAAANVFHCKATSSMDGGCPAIFVEGLADMVASVRETTTSKRKKSETDVDGDGRKLNNLSKRPCPLSDDEDSDAGSSTPALSRTVAEPIEMNSLETAAALDGHTEQYITPAAAASPSITKRTTEKQLTHEAAANEIESPE